ncbi:MAG: glycosyltransferase family 4 protein [Candidatus Methylomirabilales bacterium]
MSREGGLRLLHTEASMGWGGQEIRVLAETAWLNGHGHSAGLLAQPGSGLERRARGAACPVTSLRLGRGPTPAAVARIAGHLRRARVELVVTHSSVDAWCAGLAGRVAGVPVVRMRHLSVPVAANPLSRLVYTRLCDRVVTTAEAIRQLLIDRLGLPPKKVVSIPTGIDTAAFDPAAADGSALRRELGLDSRVPLLGMAAVLRSWKGHLVFLEAFRRVRERRPDVQAVLVGEGPYRPIIAEAVTAHSLRDAVRLLGHRDDMPAVLAALDLVVSASTGGEGVPQALLQALAMERPVVASAAGGVGEIVRPGETGWLVPVGDAGALAEGILAALGEPRRASELGRAGRRLVAASYSLDRMGSQVVRCYREVLEERAARGRLRP